MEENNSIAIELRSDEVQEVLNHIPNSLVRWGITISFSIVVLLIILSCMISYPDVISSHVTLVTETPPVHLMARSSGQIQLIIEDKEKVEKNSLIGFIINPARTEDILTLSNWMELIRENIYSNPLQLQQINLLQSLKLGELQTEYQSFSSAVEEAKRFDEIALLDNQLTSLLKSMAYYDQLNIQLKQQSQLMSQEIDVSTIRFNDDSILYQDNVISKREMFKSKTESLQTRRILENIEVLIIQNNIKSSELNSRANELLLNKKEAIEKLSNQMINAFERLDAKVKQWKQKYLFISPIDGYLTLSKFWSNNQFVNEEEEVLSVVPESQHIIGKIELPIPGSGKVKINQKVKIKFDNYPYPEYGMVIGQVESISLVPTKNSYSILVSLPRGLFSTYKRELEFKQEMTGVAEIITEDKKFIERIFYHIIKLVHQ